MPAPRGPTSIDERYGLEPVFEPGADADSGSGPELTGQMEVSCPYCGERFATVIDLSGGSQAYVEDCQVCCQPIDMRLTVTDAGEFAALEAQRCDQ